MNNESYFLDVAYNEEKTSTYNGITISKSLEGVSTEIIKINSGNIDIDEKIACNTLYSMYGKVDLFYKSSYDNYFQDLEYETNPEVKNEIDKINDELNKYIQNYLITNSKDDLTTDEYTKLLNEFWRHNQNE